MKKHKSIELAAATCIALAGIAANADPRPGEIAANGPMASSIAFCGR